MNLRSSSLLALAAMFAGAVAAFAQTPAGGTPLAQAQTPSAPASPENRSGGKTAAPQEPGKLEALIQVEPEYPALALAKGTTGYVELKFTVNAQGRVQSASVVKSVPDDVFDSAAMAALGRWRYPAQAGRTPVVLTHRFDFRPPGGAAPQTVSDTQAGSARSGAANGVRNECVHQGPVFEYGPTVQVELQSRCSDPLIVFGCAPGTGQYQGRWACTDSEKQQHLLVPPGDGRIGDKVTFATQDGTRSLSYTDQFIVSRAPNSEIWWLACDADDAACRGAAKLWTRSVDGQVANVDPRGRTSLALTRSN
ncbi:MAG TPA: energy transducer TonB [Gammaproteobacteria bacterium]|nr:energy transducer TonB [Gammaproteobacteria bacterium]